MKPNTLRLLMPTLVALAAIATPVLAQVSVSDAWVRGTVASQRATGAFMNLQSASDAALVGAASPVAKVVEVHEMAHEGGVMKMRALPRGVEIKPGETVELKPGSFHVMFMDLKQPLVKDQKPRPKGTLVFEKAGTIEIEYAIEAVGSSPGGHHHH